jgi:hypothetical protein
MSKFLITALAAFLLAGGGLHAQSGGELRSIGTAVREFAAFADLQQAEGLERVLHPQFRAVVNRPFGSTEISLMDKATYLQLIRERKIGGDTREVHLLSVDIVNQNATVKAVFEGKALRFVTFISLVRTPEGQWQVIGDMPDISKA